MSAVVVTLEFNFKNEGSKQALINCTENWMKWAESNNQLTDGSVLSMKAEWTEKGYRET